MQDIEDDGHVTIRWPDASEGPWTFRFALALVNGRYECVETAISSAPGYRPIGATFWRSVPIGRLTSQAVTMWLNTFDPIETARFDAAVADATSDDPELQSRLTELVGRQNRARLPEERGIRREAVAQVYEQALRSEYIVNHRPLAPLAAVRHHFGLATKNAAAQQVAKARKAGYLPPTTPGRARGRNS